ncbi:succinylglutamate desuccinylase [Glaciimonas sp. GG7]
MIHTTISPSLQALSGGDMTPLAHAFTSQGFITHQLASGILRVQPRSLACRSQVLISVGIHGNETGPIALLDALLIALSTDAARLQVDLMVVVGNLAAIAQNKRYLNVDLNRLFHTDGPPRCESWELRRATEIMKATHQFFEPNHNDKWHLDLHSAIRDSLFPAFAVIPTAVSGLKRNALTDLLQEGGIGAAIFNDRPASTFSAYTAARFKTASATVELGKVGPLGAYEDRCFDDMSRVLQQLLTANPIGVRDTPTVSIAQFKVAQEMIKATPSFQLAFSRDLPNFTRFAPDSLLAEDEGAEIRCGSTPEYIVFPNPDVDIGMRAGLTVIRTA